MLLCALWQQHRLPGRIARSVHDQRGAGLGGARPRPGPQRSTRGRGAASTHAAAAAMIKNPAVSEDRFGKPENAGHVGSQKLDVPRKFFGGCNPRKKDQIEDNLPQPSMSCGPENNPRMRHATGGQGESVAPRGQLSCPRLRARNPGPASTFSRDTIASSSRMCSSITIRLSW